MIDKKIGKYKISSNKFFKEDIGNVLEKISKEGEVILKIEKLKSKGVLGCFGAYFVEKYYKFVFNYDLKM